MPKTKSRGNGEGTIYYSESRKSWAAQVTLPNGKRKSFYGKTRKAVKDKLLLAQNDIAQNKYVDKSKLTVSQLLKSLVEADNALNIINGNSYLRKKETLKKIERHYIGDMLIQKVSEADCISFLKSITNYSNSVIKKAYSLLNRCFKEALRHDIIIKNPMEGVPRPKSEQQQEKVRALTIGEQKNLIDILNSGNVRYKTQMLLMMYTGMRMGEINALAVDDVNLNFNAITVRRTLTRDEKEHTVIGQTTKTYAGMRTIPLSAPASAVIKEYMKTYIPNSENLLFYDYRARKAITTSQVNMCLKRIMDKNDIKDHTVPGKISLHSLRHTYATRCIESGMPPNVLQALLGHTDIRTTLNTYCDAFSDFKSEHIINSVNYLKQKGLVV